MAGIVLSLAFGGGGACRPAVARMEARERADAFIQEAASRAQLGDVDGAIRLYEKALRRNPELGRAHLELALLLHDHGRDYLGAVYHYRCYEALRPEAEKLMLVRERRRMAEQKLVSVLQQRYTRAEPAGVPLEARDLAADLLEEKRENERLRARVAELEAQVETLRRQAAAALAVGPALSTPPPAAAATVRVYRVRAGDTLSSIATRMYGDASQWSRIYEANRMRLKSPAHLVEGMELTIPRPPTGGGERD